MFIHCSFLRYKDMYIRREHEKIQKTYCNHDGGEEYVNMYEELLTPFEIVPFEEMNKKQVVQYFDWFMETKAERLRYLEEYIHNKSGMVTFDYSPESLIDLWIWFKDKIVWEEKTPKEIEEELESTPERFRHYVTENTKKLSIQTLMISVDIAVYFGECIINNNPTIHWGYITKPKKIVDVNKPRLIGFNGNSSVFPYRLISVCLERSSEKWNDEELYETYQIWQKLI